MIKLDNVSQLEKREVYVGMGLPEKFHYSMKEMFVGREFLLISHKMMIRI